MKTVELVNVIVALSLATSLAACSSAGAASSEDENAGAIHAEESANKTFTRKTLLLKDEPATTAAAKAVGVKAWTVYFADAILAQNDTTVAYATDEAGDVKYMVMVTYDGKVSIVPFDKQGPLAASSPAAIAAMGKDIFPTLTADLGALDAKILAARASDDQCDAKLASLALKGLAVGVVVAAAGYSVFYTAVIADTLAYFGFTIGVAAAAPMVAWNMLKTEATVSWQESRIACGKK